MIDIPFMRFLPYETRVILARVALAVITLLVVWLLRSFLTRLFLSPLRRIIERNPRFKQWIGVLDILDLPIKLLVVALGLNLSVAILATDRETNIFFNHLSRSFVILAITIAAYRFINLIASSSLRVRRVTGIHMDEQLVPFVRTGLNVIIIALAVVVLLQEWQYDVSGLVAGLGLGGLAFSLAAQDTVANLFAFSTIVTDRPFVVGEYIKTPDVEGIVDHIGSRTTRIRQLNQAYVTIPNSKLAESPVMNWSRLTKRRLEFTLGVTYNTTSTQMRVLVSQIREMLLAKEKLVPDSVLVRFVNFGDSSLDILIIAEFFEPGMNDFRAIIEEVNLEIMDIVDGLGLSIAFPTRSLYIENMQLGGLPPEQLEINRQEALRGQDAASLSAGEKRQGGTGPTSHEEEA